MSFPLLIQKLGRDYEIGDPLRPDVHSAKVQYNSGEILCFANS